MFRSSITIFCGLQTHTQDFTRNFWHHTREQLLIIIFYLEGARFWFESSKDDKQKEERREKYVQKKKVQKIFGLTKRKQNRTFRLLSVYTMKRPQCCGESLPQSVKRECMGLLNNRPYLLAWRSPWRMVVYIYYITTAENYISLQLGSPCQGNRYGTEKAGGTARPSHAKSHLPGHSPPASQAGRRVWPAL